MSKQIGLIKVKGNLDGVSFYQSQGENFVRMAKGPDKKRILTDPAFQRTRENNSEFGGSAKAAKSFRSALAPALFIGDRLLTSRLLKVFKAINARSVGIRGQRPIKLSSQKALLENIELNLAQSLGGVFNAPFTKVTSAERTTATIQVNDFSPKEVVSAAPGATHFRLLQVMGVVSDYAYNQSTNRFEAVAPQLDMINHAVYSDYLPLQSEQKLSVSLSTTIPGAPVLPDNVSVVLGLGIVFHQQIGDSFYSLSQGSALKTVAVF